jgi:Ice-binding-like
MKSKPSLSRTAAAFLLLALAPTCGTEKPAQSTDGGATGGSSTGGRATGGNSAGGSSTGGRAAGGNSAGGSSTGGRAAGGNSAGGSSTGGRAAGGSSAGGSSAGGRAAGGNSAGGSSAGGNTGTIALPVNLRTAANYVILAKSGISTVPPSVITGNLGVSPAAATAITEFSLMADSTNVFSTSSQVTGMVYASNYAVPTPSNLTTAVGDMELAFTDAAGRAPNFTELGAGSIGGMTLVPGVYKWGTGVLIATNVTLTGSATAVWIFQIAQGLTMGNAARVMLTGGGLPKNVFWQVTGGVTVGTTAHLEGVVLTQTGATLATGASINGRLLAQTAVTLDTSTVVEPAP